MFDFLDSVCKIKRDPTYNLIHLKMDPLQFLRRICQHISETLAFIFLLFNNLIF